MKICPYHIKDNIPASLDPFRTNRSTDDALSTALHLGGGVYWEGDQAHLPCIFLSSESQGSVGGLSDKELKKQKCQAREQRTPTTGISHHMATQKFFLLMARWRSHSFQCRNSTQMVPFYITIFFSRGSFWFPSLVRRKRSAVLCWQYHNCSVHLHFPTRALGVLNILEKSQISLNVK